MVHRLIFRLSWSADIDPQGSIVSGFHGNDRRKQGNWEKSLQTQRSTWKNNVKTLYQIREAQSEVKTAGLLCN